MKLFCLISLCILPLLAEPGVADNETHSDNVNNVIVDLALGLETVAEGVETIAEGVEEVSKGLRSVASAFRSLSKNVPISAFEETLLELAQKVITEKLSDRIVKEIERMDNSSKDPDQKHPFDEVIGEVVTEPRVIPDPAELTTEADPIFTDQYHEEAHLEDFVTDSSTGLPGELEEDEEEEDEEEEGEDGSKETIFLPTAGSPVPLPKDEEDPVEEEIVTQPAEKEEIVDIYATTQGGILVTQSIGGDEESLQPEEPAATEIIKVLKPLTQTFPDRATEASILVTDSEREEVTTDSESSDEDDMPADTQSAIAQLIAALAAEEASEEPVEVDPEGPTIAEGPVEVDPEGPTIAEGPDNLMGDQCEGHHRQISEGCLNHYFRKLRCPYVAGLNGKSCYRYYEKCRKFQAKGNRSKGLKFCCQSLQCNLTRHAYL